MNNVSYISADSPNDYAKETVLFATVLELVMFCSGVMRPVFLCSV